MVALGRLQQLYGVVGQRPGVLFMSLRNKKTVKVDVAIDVAGCLRAIVWLVAVLTI